MCIQTLTKIKCAFCGHLMHMSETTKACRTVIAMEADFGDCTGEIYAGKTIRKLGICSEPPCQRRYKLYGHHSIDQKTC
jgi:hypothetical protein